MIINFPTKTDWRLPTEYAYIENGLVALRDYIIIHRVESVALPASALCPTLSNYTIDRLKSGVKIMYAYHLKVL